MYECEVFASLLLCLYFTLFEKYWLFLCLAFYTVTGVFLVNYQWCIQVFKLPNDLKTQFRRAYLLVPDFYILQSGFHTSKDRYKDIKQNNIRDVPIYLYWH